MNGLIGTKEAAARLKISVRRVQALIAAGRLPAEKIGNSYAIREADLLLINGRKNGRPKPPVERTQEEWNQIIDRILGSVTAGPPDLKALGRMRGKAEKVLKPIEKDWGAILDKVLGKHDFGPSDLATNKKHLEGLGRE